MADSVEFYERAGFAVHMYREDEDDPGEGFAFVEHDGVSVFDLDFVDIDPDRNGAGIGARLSRPTDARTSRCAASTILSAAVGGFQPSTLRQRPRIAVRDAGGQPPMK